MSDALLPPSRFFPPVDDADEDGLLAMGGCLEPEWLLDAYSHGIFPWPIDPSWPMTWFAPNPRGIIPLEQFHISRRLLRTLRNDRWRITIDRSFEQVMRYCAEGPGREGGCWITKPMIQAYCAMHDLGLGHSVECRTLDGTLVGGVYGVAIRGLFAAESMFHRERDASNVALCHLVRLLRESGFTLLDIQMTTSHTERFGAIEIPRDEYMRRLAKAMTVEPASIIPGSVT